MRKSKYLHPVLLVFLFLFLFGAMLDKFDYNNQLSLWVNISVWRTSEMPPHRNEVSFSQTTAVCQEMFIRFPRVFPLTLLLSYIVPIF